MPLWLAGGANDGRLRRQRAELGCAIVVLPLPQLEHEELPQPQLVVAAAAQMLGQQPVDFPGLKEAALPVARRLEHVGERLSQPAEPLPRKVP